ncbi:carboxylesterase/lipase family protein [Puia dinghuensis]|uniref:Carboxylic ester hydrolase n=1 Tax=Puia dinghuensis TaxID=1792502 RepID=A0A8J2UCT4_9BACT|nr:carboxylesterase family protein [Puia dinghuensis]GGA96913.1 carboxylic ester hydrolase [Puia dinghuensis]
MQRLVMLSLSLLAMSSFLTIAAQSPAPRVKVANGILEGVTEASGVRSFKGIPFAAPPVGNLRWREPQPAANWEGVRRADHFAARGMQLPVFADMQFRSAGMSEDCLYLNVWMPADAGAGKKLLPVLVYFFGGGFVGGDGSEYRYDGESMATKGIVAITVTYRLGIFGFFAHPELTRESPHHASGNYALLDQAAALKWVQQNIKAFGGDPKRVTIAGESAGSIAVSAQMASPLSKDLIAGAIGESGSILGALSAIPLDRAEQNGEAFAKACGANSLADLRAMTAEQVLDAVKKGNPFRFPPDIDGYFFPQGPYAIYAAGMQAHVPLLVGWNSEESNYRAIIGNDAPTLDNYDKAIKKLYGTGADSVLQVYHPASDDEVQAVATALASDRFIAFSTWKWADLQIKTGGGKSVYRYFYERPRPGATGASHSAEIEYAMGNLPTNKVYAWTPDDYKVSATMQAYFASFIKTGNPNGPGLPEWPAANTSGDPVMHINVDSKAQPAVHQDRYLFMDSRVKRE